MRNLISTLMSLGLLSTQLLLAQTVTNAPPATNAAAPPKLDPNARNIRFQFDGMPYGDVVERFAQMANKPLISNTNIQGTLTYNDPNPYNYAEALDTLNTILSMKGLMLVEAGNHLQLAPFKELPQMPHRIMRGVDATGDVRPGEIVTVVLDVKNLDAKEVADSVTPMLSSAGAIAPLSRGRGLIITDRLGNIQRIRTLLATIDTEATVNRQMKTFTLLHSSGAILSDLLNRTFGVSTAPKRTQYNPNSKSLEVLPADPNDYITAVYDEASRTLVLFGPRERLELAEELISKFEQKDGAGGDVRIYFPQTIKAEEMATIIRQAIPGVAAPNETSAAAATKARVISDNAQNRLIVASPVPGQLDQIEQLINRVDKPIHGQSMLSTNVPMRSQTIQVTKVFRPRTADATNVSTILTQALTRRNPSGQVVRTASISYDASSQSVVVSGSPGDLEVASDIVTQLETGSSTPTVMQTKFIEVSSIAEARRLQPLVEQLYRNQVSGTGGATAHAKIMVDSQAPRLIVTASEDHLARIDTLVKELRVGKPAAERRLRIIGLQHTRVDNVLKNVTDLVTEKMSDRTQSDLPKPVLTPDASNNRLLVTATDAEAKDIEEIVKAIDVAPEKSVREVRLIPVLTKTPADIIQLVNQVLEQSNQGVPPQAAPKLMPDATGKQIIVLASNADLERVQKLIQQFDQSVSAGAVRQTKSLQLYARNASEVLSLVQQLYTEQLKGQLEPAGGPATLLAEPKNNRLMVSGSEKEIARAESILRQLDPEGKTGAREETRVVRLKNATANELAGLLEKSLNTQQQQVRVLVDARSNSLVVSGEASAVQAASEIVQQLDSTPKAAPREMRILNLKSADASAISPMVNNLFAEMMKDQHGATYTPQTRIVPDAAANRIIVTGLEDEIAAVAELVQRLDQAPEQAPGARVFKLNGGDAVMLAPIVSNAMVRFDQRGLPIKRVTVTPDEKSNSLIVAGTRSDLTDAASVIEKLDEEGTVNQRQLKIVDVRSNDPDSLAALTTKVFAAQNPGRNLPSLVSITADAAGKRLMVLAPSTMIPQIETVITSLDEKPEQAARELHTVDVKLASASDLLPKVTQIYGEQNQGKSIKPASIYADAAGTRLSVYGTKEQAAAVRQIIETLQTSDSPVRETKIFDLGKSSEAQRVLTLAQRLYRDQLGGNPQLGSPDAQFITDGRTGRIIVSASTNQLSAISAIFSQLEIGALTNQAARETRTIEVGSPADVQRLMPLVVQLYQDQWKEKGELDPADAQILADAKSGRFIVTGKPDHLKKIEGIVQQLGSGKAKPEARETRIYDLTTANAMELATTVRTLYTEQSKGRLGIPSDAVILADASANRLILTGDLQEVEVIEDIVKKLDKVSAQSASTRVFKLKSADPAKVSEILSTALIRYDAYGRPQKRVSVVVDANTRTIIATGDPKELQGAAVIIEQLDSSLGSQPSRSMKVVQIKNGKASELVSKIRQLYNDQVKSQPELGLADALMMEDNYSNQIILAGSEPQLILIEKIAKELQSSFTNLGDRETQILELPQTEDASRFLSTVQQIYQEHWRNKEAGDPADAQIMPDARNGRLIVTGRTNHLAEIVSIIKQLSAPDTNSEPRETRVYDLNTSTAAELSTTVRSLYQEELKGRTIPASVQARILPDLTANRLVVSGSTNELIRVEAIIQKLDSVNAKAGNTRVFKLAHAAADQVATVLSTALVSINPYGTRTPRVSVGSDKANNLLVVNGEPKDLQAAAVIVEQMDGVTTQERREMRIIPLASGSASTISTRVRALYEDQIKGQTNSTADALILGDDLSSRLIVTAGESHLKLIEEIVKKLEDNTKGGGRQLRVIPVQHNSGTAIAALISQLFAKQIASRDEAERLVISALADDRTLAVDAAGATLERVEELVKTLDTKPAEGQNVIQTVHLKKGRAEDLAQAINQSVTSRNLTAVAQRVRVTPVQGPNSLLISGPGELVEQVMKIIKELDEESSGGEIEVRIFKLENGMAREVSSVLQQLLQTVSRQARLDAGRFVPASVSVDERSNSLIISGQPVHFKVVEKILPTLDKAPERSDRDVQFVWLRKAKAFDVVSKLEAVFASRSRDDRPIIEADTMGNSLTLIAKRGDMKQIQDLIGRLDESAKDTSLQVRMRTVDSVGVDQMARMLQNIYPQMASARVRVVEKVQPPAGTSTNTPPAPGAVVPPLPAAPADTQAAKPETQAPEVVIAVDKEANALILSGPVQELDNIDRLITDLAFSFSGNEAEFRVFSLKHADPVVVARMLGDLMRPEPIQVQPGQNPQALRLRQEKPRITVVPEPRTRGIVVRARPTDFTLLESIIKQLDTAGEIAQVDFKIVALTNASPFRILPMVQQMVLQLNATKPGDQASVVPDPRSRGLMIIARQSSIEQVEKMIHSLDSPARTPEAEVLVLPLKHASAAQLSQLLQHMIQTGSVGELTAENRELQDQIRRLKVQNEKGEPISIDLSKPIKITTETGGEGNRLILTSTPDNLTALAAFVNMLDSTALTEGVDVKLVPLEFADATSVAQTLTTIFTQGQRLGTGPGGKAQPEGETGKALTNPLNIATDTRSNTLILSGRQESLDLAMRVIKDLDQKLDRFLTEVRLYRLKHATASRLVPLLQSVFAEGPAQPGTEGLNRQVTRLRTLRDPNTPRQTDEARTRSALVIQSDDISNTLVISAKTDTLPLIQDVIEELDIPAASGLETVRIYPLNHADPNSLLKILNDLYNGPRSNTLRTEDKPIVSLDQRTSSLIVAGNGKAFAMLEALLQQLDQKLPFELRDIRILPLQNADANVLASTLQKMVDARVTQRAALNRGDADNLKIIIFADERSNSLLIGGSKDSFELVEALAKQLDTSSPALSGRIRLVPLTNSDSRVIASTLTTLFTQRYAAARSSDTQRNKPVILPDPRSNSLLISANVEDNGVIDDLLKRLDVKTDNPSLILTVLPLKHNDAARMATMLETIFTARTRAQTLPGQTPLPSEQIKVEADAINNTLIVSASKENLGEIQQLLQKLDVEPDIAGGLLQIFTLQYADATRVSSMLKSLISQGLYKPGIASTTGRSATGRDAFAVSVDPRSNTLIISASPENLAVAKEIIQKVDTKDYSEATNVKAYALKHARASTLAVTLNQFFQAKRTGDSAAINANERSVPVSVIPDDRTNMLLVTGGKEAFDVADRLIDQLDGEGIFARMNFRVFPLKNATAIKLQPVLQQIFLNRPNRVKGEPVDPITVVADAWVNALLVGASVEDMSSVEALIQKLDAEQAGPGISIQVFQLAKADARRVAQTVQSLYREGTPGATAFPISVSADERINAIIVSAGENDTKRIGELVRKLDTDQVARVSEIKVFPLRYARSDMLSTILNAALNTKPVPLGEQNPNAQSVLQFITRSEEGKELVSAALKEAVLITPDARMNSLIVSGPVDYMGLIEQIITRLDASSPQQAKIKVFTLQNADSRQMADLLMSMFRMTAAPTTASQRSIQYTLVRSMSDAIGNELGEQEVATATVGTAEQNALTVTVDPRTNSLLVGGTEHYVKLVSEIIESLDSSPANERKTEVVRLKNSQAADVAAAIRTFLDQERQRVVSVLGAQAIGTAQRVLEHEVAVVAEPLSNTLLVSANPRYFMQIKEVIDELDKPQAQVMIQVILAEVTLDALTDLGLEWTYHVPNGGGNVNYGVGTDFNMKRAITENFSSAVSGNDFSFLLRALKDEGRLEVLSRPQIVTADNKPASINVGQRVPLITDSRVTAQNDTVNSFRYEDIGVNLTVTPKISPDGFVRMEIGTTNSSISSSTVEINKNATVPIINQRRANTTVSCQSGQTIMIGGLIGTTDDQRIRKVPWLGDIPYVGLLFRTKHNLRDRKELLILLTPQVLANNDVPPVIQSLDGFTREHLDKSHIKDQKKRDDLQKQILDPLFPEKTFETKQMPKPKV